MVRCHQSMARVPYDFLVILEPMIRAGHDHPLLHPSLAISGQMILEDREAEAPARLLPLPQETGKEAIRIPQKPHQRVLAL